MIEFRNPDEVKIHRRSIIVGTSVVGEIWETEHGYQCQLKPAVLRNAPSCLTMNGTGKTEALAIYDAICGAEVDATALLAAANFIRAELEGGVLIEQESEGG